MSEDLGIEYARFVFRKYGDQALRRELRDGVVSIDDGKRVFAEHEYSRRHRFQSFVKWMFGIEP